uniref:ubiquitin-like-specific protease 1D isoform X2 n=1 Tax=Erigeron canadensis TaxID=72917 RepID=UPI001CB8FE27|nr:ubiquitin-like-specific protease 1D isoform X2 [Erigeron canadensis]
MPLPLGEGEIDMMIDADDPPHELLILSSGKPNRHGPENDIDYGLITETEAEINKILTKKRATLKTRGDRLPDKGEKLRADIRRCEAELERREKFYSKKGGVTKCEDTMQLSDLSDDDFGFIGASRGKKRSDQKYFANLFDKKLDRDKFSRTVDAFQDDELFSKRDQGRRAKNQAAQFSSRERSTKQTSSRTKPFSCQTNSPLFYSGKHKFSNGDKKVNRSTTCSLDSDRDIWESFKRIPAPKSQPSTKWEPRCSSDYRLLDEDEDDEPLVWNLTPCAEKLSDCMKDVEVYYPSRDDQDPVQVIYTDMKCLDPEAWLSSAIMNYYIRYLQQLSSASENAKCNYHFFNTYFYNKLKKLDYQEGSFHKFRKWWKNTHIFEKAYILLPIHENAHWSLVIICIPNNVDELGPVVLHLDSLGLHDSESIFVNIKSFLKEEWSYLQKSDELLDPPIKDEIWENLGCRITDRKVKVPRQRNAFDCGLFVLFYMERFIKEAPKRLREEDLSMFSKEWFRPEEASNLRGKIYDLLVQEFKIAKEKETTLSPKC